MAKNCLFMQNGNVTPPGSLSLCSPAVSEVIALAGRSLSAGIDLEFYTGKDSMTPKKTLFVLPPSLREMTCSSASYGVT